MANPPRTRKRVRAVRRAPDGSAFEKCDECGESVPVALVDMHECKLKKKGKRVGGECAALKNHEKQRFEDQPRSAFRFFMESFLKACEDENLIDADRKGYEKWKNMSEEERQVYVLKADKVNLAYEEALCKEMETFLEGDDEADSANAQKFDEVYEYDSDFENFYGYESFLPWSFCTYDWSICLSLCPAQTCF